jgi:maltose O-acetyltransferase
MLSGILYSSQDHVLIQERKRAKLLTRLYNQTSEDELEKRLDCLSQLFGYAGKNIWIEPTFHCDYGYNISIGDNFYANYDCIILDVCRVNIGNNVFFGPRVCIYTAAHPIDAEVRATGLEYGKPVNIGNNVWIGGNTVINPGVTIGDNVVIGSGTVVTKDIPSGVIAVGNPNRILRAITDDDQTYWHSKQFEYLEEAKI